MDPKLAAKASSDATVKDFLVVMAICNSVVVSATPEEGEEGQEGQEEADTTGGSPKGKVTCNNGNLPNSARVLKYEAESPDEGALVHVSNQGVFFF